MRPYNRLDITNKQKQRLKEALNKFLTSMKNPVFKYYLHINGYLHCANPSLFFSSMLSDLFL